jgi:predicted esterase
MREHWTGNRPVALSLRQKRRASMSRLFDHEGRHGRRTPVHTSNPSVQRLLLVALLFWTLPLSAARLVLQIEAAGLQRRVLVHAPASAGQTPAPLIIVFHGRGDDAAAFARAVNLHRDWPEAIVVSPRGELHPGKPQRGWQYRRGQYDDRDLLLTDALLAELGQRFRIAPEQTFAAGFSNGGHFVFLLMAERPELFAAHAVLGAVNPEHASQARPRPLLYLFGRGEDRRHQGAWQATIEALIRHQQSSGPLEDVLGCCKLQRAGSDGAPFVFGLYNAGHIWPAEGNAWLRAFFSNPQMRAAGAEASSTSPRQGQ